MGQYNSGENKQLNRKNRYFSILKQIDIEYPSFSDMFFNIGYPLFTNDQICPSAQIKMDKISNDIIYIWGENFFDSLSDKKVMFIIAHETFHIFLDHVKLIFDAENQFLYNLACDAVINDILYHYFDFEIPDNIVTGENLVGFNCADKTVEYIYSLLNDEGEYNFNFIDNHEDWENFNEEILDEIIPLEYDAEHRIIQQKGDVSIGDEHRIIYKNNEFRVDDIINSNIKQKLKEKYYESWRKPNYKLTSVYPDIILPFTGFDENKDILSIIFAIDVSYSIPLNIINDFIAIAKNHMDVYDIHAFTFDTQVYPLDLKNDEIFYGGGGTSFDAVARFVIDQQEDKFDCIFVLTDAYGGDIYSVKINPQKWIWMITPDGGVINENMGKSYRINSKYLKD